jgi:phosphonate transport system substrate-binding protein
MQEEVSRMKRDTILMGAAAFGPSAITIWDGFKAWFNKNGLPFEYILYNTYDRQISELLLGHIDAAWNDPLAWIRSRRLAEAQNKKLEPLIMRDCDFDVTSVIAVREDSKFKTLTDLKGATIAVGSPNSVESTLLPVFALNQAGLHAGKDYKLLLGESSNFGYRPWIMDAEVAAAKALLEGKADAAGLSEYNYKAFLENGTIPAGATRVLNSTPIYDHCNLTFHESPESVPRELIDRMRELFLKMSFDDPELRPFMELEYVKQWKPARTTHYANIDSALDCAESFGICRISSTTDAAPEKAA